jgi:autotransporter-associated beta strand protein
MGKAAVPNCWGRAGVGARRVKLGRDRAISSSQLSLAAALAVAPVLAESPAAAQTADNPVEILFVGNSFTHGRYSPALNYNAGPGNATDGSMVRDLLCPSLNAAGACTWGAGAVAPVTPTAANTPGGTLQGQLNYLQGNPSAQYTEPGPFSGVAGVFLQFTKEAGLHYNVSLVAVSSATLQGYLNNTGSTAGTLPLIANAKYDQVVMQDQSFRPLPATVTINGQTVPTRGNPAAFQAGVNGLVNAIDTADAKAGKAKAGITLYETQPLASYGYTSSNPNAPIFGSSTAAQNGGNPAFAPYVGAPNPITQMASDLHNAYTAAASTYNGANPAKSHVNVALAGDAWASAINLGIAVQNPYLTNNPVNRVNLWDSNPLTACCTTPIGYHPSAYGVYLNALSIFYKITGIDPVTLDAETNASNPLFQSSAAHALGISATDAQLLTIAASDTIRAGMPVSSFELQVGTIRAVLGGSGGLIKDGPDTVTLTALNTYTGSTAINGGVLQVNGSIASSSQITVNNGGTLTGNGTVGNTIINAGGLFAPGNGTAGSSMGVTGNLAFQSGATYLVQLDPSGAQSAKVSGTADLGSAAVNVVSTPGNSLLKQYTILSAEGGVSGTFGPTVVTNLPASIQTALSYDANHAFLNLSLSFAAAGPLTANQQSVGDALSNSFNRQGSIPFAFAALTASGLTQASGETATGSQQTAFNVMAQFMGVITDSFIEGRGIAHGSATGPTTFVDGDQANAYAAEGRKPGATERDAYAMIAKVPQPERRDLGWSVWAAGFGGS